MSQDPLILRGFFRAALLVIVIVIASAVAWWRTQEVSPPPIYIPDATATWVDGRHFDIEAPAFYWNDTCSSIWVNWWVQTRWNGNVPITTRAVKGPFAARGDMPPRYKISITPHTGPSIKLRATIPDWLEASDVLMVEVDDIVPDDEPCASGWSGTMHVFQLQINPRRETAP